MIKNNREKIFELKIEEDDDMSGIDSISLVDEPAIEVNWIAFNKEKSHEFHIPDGEDNIYIEKLMSTSQDEQELFDEGWVVDKIIILGKDKFYSTDPNGPSAEDEKEYNVRYKYILNPSISGQRAIIPTTRDFCKTLINQGRVWRIEDMDATRNDFGDSAMVWRGGYNCRHVWARIEYRKDITIINKASVNKGKIDPQAPVDTRVLGYEQPSTVTGPTLANPSPSTIKNLGLSKQRFDGKPKVSLDYDGVLSTPQGEELYKELIDAGNDVYIVTARNESEGRDVLDKAKALRLPQDKVLFTNGQPKSNVLNRIGITKHYDNNIDVINEIKKNAPSVEAIKFKLAEVGPKGGIKESPKDNMSKQNMDSISDYPDSVKNNAKAVLKYVDENGWGSCGTDVGKGRANDLAQGNPISLDTIKRMYSYLSRHEVDLESSKSFDDGCGYLMYMSWGGKSALSWAKSKLNDFGYDVGGLPAYVDELPKKKKKSYIDEFEYLFVGDTIKCENCGWQWNMKDGGTDPYVCHKCGYDNSQQNMSKQHFTTDNEKHIVLGPAMIPDQKIFRKDGQGNPYYVYFSPDTIKMIAEKYMKNKYTDNNDLMHDGTAVKDIHVLESWIKEDGQDKSNKYGFENLPVGTWFVSMKVNNPDVWKQIKEGKLNGFSVSGYFEEVAKFCMEEMFLKQVVEILNNIND
jgi:hypothetical protein